MNRSIENHTKILQNKLEMDQEYLKQARRDRHDYRHHNRMIMEYAQMNDIPSIIKYIDNYEDRLQKSVVDYCDNICINNILHYYIRKAESLGIDVYYDIRAPYKINIEDVDMVTILANALENAVKGCQTAPEPRRIEIKIYKKSVKLIIECKNTALGNIIFKNGIPQRSDQKGLGIQGILASAKRYQGDAVFEYVDETFTCRVLLNDLANDKR